MKLPELELFLITVFNDHRRNFLFGQLLNERALRLDVSMLPTTEEEKLRRLLCSVVQTFVIKLSKCDLKVRRGDGLYSPTWYTCGTFLI